ncbi:class I SAM-dependent methyltransferase [Mycobacterium lepromatosis]|nr:class I SAM-dependent methyltransferase [Mycobacterium lepromatosis]
MTLKARIAKIDLAFDKLGLPPCMTLLDVVCGLGASVYKAQVYDVGIIGFTLSNSQTNYACRQSCQITDRAVRKCPLQVQSEFCYKVGSSPMSTSTRSPASLSSGLLSIERCDVFSPWRTACFLSTGSCCCTPSSGCIPKDKRTPKGQKNKQ